MSAPTAQLCHITVYGPGGRADLAVPSATSVSSLLPVLLKHTSGPGGPGAGEGAWTLQRLGEPPLDPDGTPETLDWLDGEIFHLRRTAEALPELDFDDVADGMATVVNRRADRWQPEFNRWLFAGLSGISLLLLAIVVLQPVTWLVSVLFSSVLAGLLIGGALVAGYRTDNTPLILLTGLGGCGFAALAGAIGVGGGQETLALQAIPVLFGGLALVLAAGILGLGHALFARAIPVWPVTALGLAGAIAVGSMSAYLFLAWTPAKVAAVLCAILLLSLVFAPHVAIRSAHIRGPRLPRTAAELPREIDPAPAAELARRTGYADDFLTSIAVAAALSYAAAVPVLATAGDGFSFALAALFAVIALIRGARLTGVWQRIPLLLAGFYGSALVATSMVGGYGPLGRTLTLLGLAGVFLALLLAMLRPVHQRLLPIWGHLANWAEILTAVAVLPVLVELFGFYAWAASLMGS
ncbi:type VII secretion integral membrane protein EccD [Crossiella sp. CA198]|uniref:type VII secretion integral membrane protein EccD n=1 Tax=Crossiella sp. CA198 TaxID=3455607 RepID=UPI003F8D70E8